MPFPIKSEQMQSTISLHQYHNIVGNILYLSHTKAVSNKLSARAAVLDSALATTHSFDIMHVT